MIHGDPLARSFNLYNNQDLTKEMGRNARKRAEQFTREAYRQRLGALLHVFLKDQEGVSTKFDPKASARGTTEPAL
jgi:hypothetical protein